MRHGKTESVVVQASKYDHKLRVFVACDDGSRICAGCLGEVNGAVDQYGPTRKHGECYHCGFKVEVR